MTPLVAVIVWSDTLARLNWNASLWSPIVLVVAVSAAVLSRSGKPPPTDRGRLLGAALAAGAALGLIGWLVLEPVTNKLEQLLAGPFIFSKWFVPGFWLGWTWGVLATDRPRRPPAWSRGVIAFAGLTLGTLALVGSVLVPRLIDRDIAYWNHALDPGTLDLEPTEAQAHFSQAGRERIFRVLQQRPDTIQAGVLRRLHELGVTQVLSARQLPKEMVAAAIARIPPRQPLDAFARSTMMKLAANPALDDAAFGFLCARGDTRVLGVLARHHGSDPNRQRQLLEVVRHHLTRDLTERERRGWRDLLNRLERRWPTKEIIPRGPENPRPETPE